ncbi:MAG: hypothetical protein PF517_07790 [Salinivirgaceae bacterium]|jgi:tetratricopeptide (TPR) repeat protein|nr:hypothetical protein [Salinivirgaceae bacterium]
MTKQQKLKKNTAINQKIVFRLLTLLIPFIILVFIEGILRTTGYGNNLNLFVQNTMKGYDEYLQVNPIVGKKYFQNFHHTTPANDIFLKNKKNNTFRIFVIGSSTVFGFPYNRNLMFSRILHKRLEETFPNKNIEVINTAISAINSFTLLDFTDQILKQEPDAILIYAGHNEFYGAFGIGSNETMSRYRILTQIHIQLMDLKLYQLLRNIITSTKKTANNTSKKEDRGTLMKQIVGNKQLLLHGKEYQIAMKVYRQNMNRILSKINTSHTPVFLSEIISNVGDLEPFNSATADSLKAAIDVFKQGKEFYENGDFANALDCFEYARDLDCVRFRASSEINQILHSLAKEHKTTIVPMMKYFQENSPHKIMGDNLMIDHVHPNIQGQFIMADAFFKSVVESNLIDNKEKIYFNTSKYFKTHYAYTELDSLVALHKINNLKSYWPFVADKSTYTVYAKNYKPNSYVDSLAFFVTQNRDFRIVDARLKLAEEYKNKGMLSKAFKEYDALLQTNPYVAINYTDAANCLIQMSDFEKALGYFKKSLEYEESYATHYKLGELHLILTDYKNALKSFEKARILSPKKSEINKFANTYLTLLNSNREDYAKEVASDFVKLKISN